MNRFRPYILALSILCAGLLAYGFLTLPKPRPADYDGFSSARVIEDIEVISREHHSVAHPQERAKVREYLAGRLEEMGGKVTLYQYDSLVGPKNRAVTYTFDGVNVLAEFPPMTASADTTYLMLVAHYDSRYPNVLPKNKTVLSYGAADDGYGVGVTLETVHNLLKVRQDWKQGVKVLFTDAEEVGMLGMTAAWENDRHIFDNVGLMINLEARGTYGPALLFETCPGNEELMELYASAARYPYTYSLTTVVYGFMPNFTDFTIVKDYIPGINFSTIADVNHYHTDKDNFENVSQKSIQHYGEQVLPIAQAYVTDPVYSDKDYLKAEDDTTSFTIPALGLLNVSKGVYKVINAVIFLLFALFFAMEGVRGRVKAARIFKSSCIILFVAIGVLAFGELVAYLSALAAGAYFKPFGVIQGIQADNIIMIVMTVLLVAASVFIYLNSKGTVVRQKSGSMRASAALNAATGYSLEVLYGTLALMTLLSAVLVFTLGENLMFLIPLAFATAALILWRLTSLKVWLLAAIVLILLHAFSFLFALAMALTIGAYGAVAMLAFLDLMVLIPLADLYLMPERVKK
ncbi:MAG: M28 family peptidase [Bacteroidales bacterium]|nr:M28 family peptidase [Bacteroidales bacterium]